MLIFVTPEKEKMKRYKQKNCILSDFFNPITDPSPFYLSFFFAYWNFKVGDSDPLEKNILDPRPARCKNTADLKVTSNLRMNLAGRCRRCTGSGRWSWRWNWRLPDIFVILYESVYVAPSIMNELIRTFNTIDLNSTCRCLIFSCLMLRTTSPKIRDSPCST